MFTPVFENLGSLITYKDADGQDQCLGYLMDFKLPHGVHDAALGKVDINPLFVAPHNKALDAAMLKGLDENCAIGQHGTFYVTRAPERPYAYHVTTFCGTVVADAAHTAVTKTGITFWRAGKQYSGRVQKDADCFNFRRVA